MFKFGASKKEGWFFTKEFQLYQKVKDRAYVYVSRQFGFYTLQMYERGTTSMCTFEARSYEPEKLFELGEEWLKDYSNYDHKQIELCPYYIGNSNWKDMHWVS